MSYSEKYMRLHEEWDKAATEMNRLPDLVMKLEGDRAFCNCDLIPQRLQEKE